MVLQKIEENKYGMYRAALSILRSPEDAQDAQSEAICAAWEKLDTLRDRDKFKPWIMRILQNECYKLCRERKNTVSLLDDIPSSEGERTDLPTVAGSDVAAKGYAPSGGAFLLRRHEHKGDKRGNGSHCSGSEDQIVPGEEKAQGKAD
jgi:RNA polymerase sigma factor (sigma-70 family)